jgi:hypothetical protein
LAQKILKEIEYRESIAQELEALKQPSKKVDYDFQNPIWNPPTPEPIAEVAALLDACYMIEPPF